MRRRDSTAKAEWPLVGISLAVVLVWLLWTDGRSGMQHGHWPRLAAEVLSFVAGAATLFALRGLWRRLRRHGPGEGAV